MLTSPRAPAHDARTSAGWWAALGRPVRSVWHRLINIGMQPSLTVWQSKRVHLLNGICCITIAIYTGYVAVFWNSPDWLTFRICLFGVAFNLPPLLLNHYRRYDAAAYYIILSVTLLCSFIAVARRYDGVEYYLISNSIVAMLFFRSFWKIALLFGVNVGAYFAVRYAMTVVEPFLYMPDSVYFYNVNVSLFFMTLFLVVYYFRAENFHQEELLTRQNESLAQSLEHLQTTQVQLVQQEKLASLGALTAGIAHEIQNPLNFVDNFSEVGVELVQELRDELRPEQLPEKKKEAVARLLDDLTQSQTKVNEHASRASNIVKDMLQHSRPSTGKRQPTNLNALADEYLRLSYHGLRAKDKSFNVALTTDFNQHLGPVLVVPEDIGRVLLNLFNNAFYAVRQQAARLPAGTYKPVVAVSTQRAGQGVLLRVRDNGTGIAPEILDKIMHPFFTTKPPGEGTGLGLSLSYDIVTKGHGGTLTVNSVPGQYSEFTVWLPESLV
ncbi:His Kinase A (phospho-acceptor) domain-containing protein [Hymenobacter daecheongensis DSM 21074]|uniref:histidine kinase n=1 Tax=Hymenobacter daecheongensis DSM 21074 TaxID=1121955 RepID=A0A1M6ANT5_9BACT|nr:ATP-binding protein [Hymenobacter daecheongensis]SHI37863.1 His Kinase A (phospho-acceptor) domain-containing protein [Hymenobacter daecheongensis DSM 21074]